MIWLKFFLTFLDRHEPSSSQISSSLTLTNVKTQSRTLVTDLAALLPSPPPTNMKVRLLSFNVNMM